MTGENSEVSRCCVNHRRSDESRKRRNKKYKLKRKQGKSIKRSSETKKRLQAESKIMSLQWENKVLKSALLEKKKYPLKFSCTSRRQSTILSTSLNLTSHVDSILQKFNAKLPIFDEKDLILKQDLNSGVYGNVKLAFVKSIQQNVAIKYFHAKIGYNQKLAEASICKELSGHQNFPYCFGVLKNCEIIMEYIGNSNTLWELLKQQTRGFPFKDVCIDIVRAVNEMHMRGILHNDLHGNNIVVRNGKFVKIIDFGKCTLIEDPIIYNIKPGSKKQEKYNKFHRHLSYELRNVPGSKTRVSTDVFSIGYNFKKIAFFMECKKLQKIADDMMSENFEKRPSLAAVLLEVLNI